MSSRHLAVLLYDRHVADLEQTHGGQHRVHYRDDPGTTPLSLTMPTSGGPFSHRVVDPVLEGLLPERESARESMARHFDVSSRNPFALLAHIGLDCAGAVQFCAADEIPDVLARSGSLEALSDQDIEARLSTLRTDPGASWLAPRERWSLAGAQAKIALRREGDAWFEATGAEPTTHIVKPGVEGFRHQALNEHISLQTARRAGLSAAQSRFERFGSEPALVVERYDRRRSTEHTLVRLHQEDLCQATGTYPGDKYESAGGPRAVQVIELLRTHSTLRDRQRNLDAFVDALAFNILIAAPDAHAKNYSVLLLEDVVRLAPPLRRRLRCTVRLHGPDRPPHVGDGDRRPARACTDHPRPVVAVRPRGRARPRGSRGPGDRARGSHPGLDVRRVRGRGRERQRRCRRPEVTDARPDRTDLCDRRT